ncbi:MAG: hypothetical protein K5894_10810, partial [Lachnospiraceae bacterium]|nr:hypothetical protein [Lachnospiraceae bacterium]
MGNELEEELKNKKIPLFRTEEKEKTKKDSSNIGSKADQIYGPRSAVSFSENKSLNESIGTTIIQYDKKLKEEQQESGLEVTVEKYTMKQILESMMNDSEKKHRGYKEMEEAFSIVANYSEYLSECKKRGHEIRNYRDAIRMAELTAKRYQVDHKSLFFLTGYGKQRYKLSCRIVDIMGALKSETTKAHEEYIKKVDNKVENTRVEDIIKEKDISEEDKGKLIKKWFSDGDKYKELIKKILGNEDMQNVDRETLERILVDKNSILIANKVTISMICEENPHLTLGLSKMKDKLMKYVNNKLEADEESQKCLFSDVEEFRNNLNQILDFYYSENEKLLQDIKTKKAKMIEELDIDAYDDRFWARDDINDLLMNTDNEQFSEKLGVIKGRMDDNFEIIDTLVDDKQFSSLCSASIKKKIKSRLGDLMLYAGEMDVADKVRDSLSYLNFVAPQEYAAEEKISDLMKLFQIPSTEKDVFAKYLSGKSGIMGVTETSYVKLQYRALSFMQNLRGLDKKKKIFGINKLRLNVETWEKIDKLKCGMGEFSDKEFKERIDKLIEDNKNNTDLTKPNVRYADYSANRQVIKKNRNIGFSKRILGELFLESEEIQGILDEKEVEYFRNNLLKKICPDESAISEMEFLPTSDIKKIANLLKNNLVDNKDQIKALRKQKGATAEHLPEILMEIAVRKSTSNGDEIKRIAKNVVARHIYDKKQQTEMRKMLAATKSDSENDGTLEKERLNHFREMLNFVKSYKAGRYSLFAEKLCSKTDFYEKLMASDKKGISDYLDDTVEKKIGSAIEGINAADSVPAMKQLYLDRRFDLIYDGKIKGEIILFKNDLKREERRYFEERETSAKKVEKNIITATDAATKEFIKQNKKLRKDVSKKAAAHAVLSCAHELILDMHQNKDHFETLLSADALKNKILKGVENYESNMLQAELFVNKLSANEDSIFFGIGDRNNEKYAESQKNHARFLSNIRKELMLLPKDELMKKLPGLVENFEKSYRKDLEYTSVHKVNEKETEEAKKLIENIETKDKIREARDKHLG